MVDTVKDLLADADKGRYKSQSILTWLFRDALVRRRVNQFTWNKRLQQFFDKPHNKINQPDRGNMNKTLTNDDMTWDGFKKAVDFLNAQQAILKVELTWRNGRESLYSVPLDFTAKLDPIGDPDNAEHNHDLESFIPKKKEEGLTTLARLFRQILAREQYNEKRWDAMLDAWVKNPNNGIPQNRVEMNRERNERHRELLRPKMTWSVFRKALIFLDPEIVVFTLELHWSDGVTLHQIPLPTP